MSTPSLTLVNDDREWDALVYGSPQCNPFMLSAFISSLCVESTRYVFASAGKPEASILILNPGAEGFRAPYKYSLYQGIAYTPSNKTGSSLVSSRLRTTQELLRLLNGIHPRHSLCLHPTVEDLRAFQWFNYDCLLDSRYLIDLMYTGIISIHAFSSYEDYFTSIRSSRRQDQKKSVSAGFQVVHSNDLEEFLRLYELTFARQRQILGEDEISFVRNMLTSLLDSEMVKILACINHLGDVVSSIVILSDPASDYYLFGATDPKYRSYGVNTLLLLDAIKASFLAGKKYFDMVGINSPNRGDFKTSFSAAPRQFFSVCTTKI